MDVSEGFLRGAPLLTDQEIARSWRVLFHRGDFSEETFARAEALLAELRPENPLRHRLSAELAELRRRHAPAAKTKSARQPKHLKRRVAKAT